MLLYLTKNRFWMAIVISLFIRSQHSLTISPNFRATNLQIEPEFVILNSSTIYDFLCFKHVNDGLPFDVKISRNISSDQLEISQIPLNTTTIRIRLQTKNYVGTFHLYCYSKGMESKGTLADVAVVAPSGTLQLAEKCRVYDRQYIKCIIQAPIIARAIQEGYAPNFKFNELIHPSESPWYNTRYVLLRNESTHENLTFRWKPNVDGQFPNGLIMNMTAMLSHFVPSNYRFDMTPIFRITPKFLLQILSPTELQMKLTPQFPMSICEKSVTHLMVKSIESQNRTWTLIEPNRLTILINDLLPGSIHRVCMKCRERLEDPPGDEVCEDVKTFDKYAWLLTKEKIIIAVTVIGAIVALIVILLFWFKRSVRNHRQHTSKTDDPRLTDLSSRRSGNIYQTEFQQNQSLIDSDRQLHEESEVDIPHSNDLPDDDDDDDDTNRVSSQRSTVSEIHLAPTEEVIYQSSPATIKYFPLFIRNLHPRH